MPITLIYTRTDKWLISKENVDWQIWQFKLYWFTTSLTFGDIAECADFLKDDFHLTDNNEQYIIDKVSEHPNKSFELYITDDNQVTIVPLDFDILQSEGEVIDWQDRIYFYIKLGDDFQLEVYPNTRVQQVKRITLSKSQVNLWQKQGNEYIKQLVSEIRQNELYIS